MVTLYFLLYVLAAFCFGLAAARFAANRVDFLGLGLLAWILVPLLQTLQKL